MPLSLSCKGCKSTLKVPDQFAGKKVKCPKCAAVLLVPGKKKDDDEEEFVAVEVVPEERVKTAPARKSKPNSRYDDDEDDEDDDDRPSRRVKTSRDDDRRSARYREEDEDDRRRKKGRRRDDDDDDRRGRGGNFKPCPQCGERGAKRVMWTAWGSFYGPAMFNHVRCPECSYCYNGRTGRSNALAAVICVTVPLIGIGAIIGAIVYMLVQRGHI